MSTLVAIGPNDPCKLEEVRRMLRTMPKEDLIARAAA
jgi:hypothetical protein